MNQKSSPIQQKLMRLVLVTSGVVLFLTCAAFFAYEFYTYRESTREKLYTLGEIISANSTAALTFDDVDNANEILRALKAEKHIVAACLYDEKGNLFAKYPGYLKPSKLPVHPVQEGYKYINGRLEGFQPVMLGEKIIGTLFLQSDMGAIYDRFTTYTIIIAAVVIIGLIVAYLLSRRLQKTISEPILDLAKTAGVISHQNDYSVRAKKYDGDELGVLTDAFNHMLDQIQRQNNEITSFTEELGKKVNERTYELEQANNELLLKNEFVETIIDSSVDVIAVFDKELNYVMINKYAREIYELGEENIIGRNIVDVFPKIRTSQMYSDVTQALHGKIIHNPYYKSTLSDRVLENFYIPLKDKDDNVFRVLVIGHDITEIIEANEKLKTVNKELEKSNSDLEQFAYIASHDLQEPLRKIQTFSQLVQKSIEDKELSQKYVGKIYAAAARMTDLIKAVLNYSRLSNEDVKFQQVDLNLVVENIKTDLELAIVEKEAEITVGELPMIAGDRLQLNQLFLNLITNSLKFSKNKPVISISGEVSTHNKMSIIDGFNLTEKYATIIFKDNGIGFQQHYADKIFNVFQRLHSRNEFPGTGIGLALCKKIVENHNGVISVESTVGEGTTFTVHLPLNNAAE